MKLVWKDDYRLGLCQSVELNSTFKLWLRRREGPYTACTDCVYMLGLTRTSPLTASLSAEGWTFLGYYANTDEVEATAQLIAALVNK